MIPGRGDPVLYKCLGVGVYYDAVVRDVRPDGRLDLSVDAGCKDRVELTRIEFVDRSELRRGTCSIGSRADQGVLREKSKAGVGSEIADRFGLARRAVRRA